MARSTQFVRMWTLLRQLESEPGGITRASYPKGPAGERRFYRDIDALEKAGVPIYSEPADGRTSYRLVEGYRRARGVPLQQHELIALSLAQAALPEPGSPLAQALEQLLDKLTAMLAPGLRELSTRLRETIVGDRFGKAPSPHADHLELLSAALRSQTALDLTYRSRTGKPSTRRVDPYNLWTHRGSAYLVGYCHAREAIRTFALARIQQATPAAA